MPTYELIYKIIPVLGGLYGDDIDALLPLDVARHAPEIRDVNGEPAFSVYKLRRACEAGELKGFRPGHGWLVTRRSIRAWKDGQWHGSGKAPVSNMTKNAGNGSSETTILSPVSGASTASTESALQLAGRLKRQGRSTSSTANVSPTRKPGR